MHIRIITQERLKVVTVRTACPPALQTWEGFTGPNIYDLLEGKGYFYG